MKLFHILSLVVGSAAAILASTTPAHALTWNWSFSGTTVSASGTFTTTDADANGAYTITGINGLYTREGTSSPILGLLPDGSIFGGNDNKINGFDGLPGSNGFSFSTLRETLTGGVNVYREPTGEITALWFNPEEGNSGEPVSYNASQSVPFDIPGGATIPALGGLLALGVMRKARKSIASKTRIVNPVTGTIS